MRCVRRFILVSTIAVALVVVGLPVSAGAEALSPAMEHARGVIPAKVAATQAAVVAGQYPFYTKSATWKTVGPRIWAAGFLPGSLWNEYQRTGDSRWRDRARSRQKPIGRYSVETGTPDLGFLMLNSFRLDYHLTGNLGSRDVALAGAKTLALQYDRDVGMVRSRTADDEFIVVTDTMMNIELLYWAANNGGDPKLRELATSHALRTARDFIRPDGSSFHYVAYDDRTGAVLHKGTSQGAFDESTWSRGHAWLIYGLSVAYRETGDTRFLDAAHRASDYWVSHVPADSVPFWDFDAPGIPAVARDSSAAAVAASAFIELGCLDSDEGRRAEYLQLARTTLEALSSDSYLAEGAPELSVLLHGSYYGPTGRVDHGTSWGDFYFAEALMRLRTQVLRVAGPDRYEGAVRASQLGFGHADTVVIASGAGFADALSASSLAGSFGAPILLVRPNSVPDSVSREVARLGATKVWIVGGPRSVSESVARGLDALPGVGVERVSGSDRYEVAAAVASRVAAMRGAGFDGRVVLVRGDIFPDALSVSPVAYSSGIPVLLTRPASAPAHTAQALRADWVRAVVICGGSSSVSPALESSLRDSGRYERVERVAGRDRYSTASAFARWARSGGLADGGFVGVASGLDYPDALMGGAVAGARRGVLVLTRRSSLPGATTPYLAGAGVATDVWLFGGQSRVTPPVENAIRTALPEQ